MDTTENKFILTLCIEENVFGFFKSQTNIFHVEKKIIQNVGKIFIKYIFLSDYIYVDWEIFKLRALNIFQNNEIWFLGIFVEI